LFVSNTSDEVLKLAKEAMRAGRFWIAPDHVEGLRGPQRHVKYHDIKKAVLTATEATPSGSSWRLTGQDLDGDPLTIAIVLDGQSIRIVTVF
jgi:hypothetical protein